MRPEDAHYFTPYPVGEEIYDIYKRSVERVVAHVEGVWYGTQNPWYGIITEPVAPDRKFWRRKRVNLLWETSKHNWAVLAGTLPEFALGHCLNGWSMADITPVRNIRRKELSETISMFVMPPKYDCNVVYGVRSSDDDFLEVAYDLTLTMQYHSDADRRENQILRVARYLDCHVPQSEP